MSVKSLATAFALTCGLAGAAQAAPISVAPPATVAGTAIETVAYGCGPGWAPNPWGRCRPMFRRFGGYGPRPFYGPPRFYGPRYGYYRPRPPVPFY